MNILRRKRILQGVRTLYISPKLLHVTMWCNWWNNYADMVNIELLRGSIQGRMLEWFHDMFVYASESRAATRVAERLLAPEGPLASLAGLSIPGNPSLFFALAQASPKAALCTLKSALESATESEKKQFGPGRREIVHGLERLAVPATGFFDAVACLLLLAEAENEDWSNNASGVFVSMFTLGYGKVAASELAPAAKIPYLRDLLHSENRAWRALAVRALRESLSPFVTRIDIGEVQGLRSMALRWMPVNYNELWEAYKSHVELLAEASETLGAPDAEAAARGVMDHVRSLLQIPPLAPRVVELLRRFAQSDSLRDAVIESIVAVIHYDRKGLPESIVLLLKQLQTELTEVSFSARLRRYAGLQLLEDNFDDDGEYTEEIPQPLRELCSEALASPARLDTELPWLVTGKAKNGFQFGALLGEQDHSLSLWTVVKTAWLKAGEHRSDFFVGGYLAGLFKQDEGLWELVIGELFATPEARRDLTALVWRSGMSDAVAFELVALSRTWDIDPQTFRLFVYGGVVNRLPLAVVKNVIDILLKRSTTRDADVALDILQSRLWGHADEEVGLLGYLDRVLRHPAFIQGDASKSATDNMRDYHWTQGAKKLLGADQDRALTLAVECIAHFGCSGSVTDRYFAGALEFLDEFMGLRPVEMWKAVGNELGPKIDTKAYKLLQWLRGKRRDTESTQSTGLELVPTKIVMDWISKSSGHRSVLMAQYCPPIISPPLEQPSIARLILEKYGNSSDVRNALHANYFTGLFSGPPSAHYQNKLKAIEKQIAEEPNTVVRLWLQEEVESLTRSVQVELEREEAQEW